MSISRGFSEHLIEVLAPLGPIKVRKMFGGAGVYCGDLMFALVADDTLFLKSDDGNRRDFESEGLSPFTYATRNGRKSLMSYWQAPERLLDDGDEMVAWAGKALAAANRSGSQARQPKPAASAPKPPRKAAAPAAGSQRARAKTGR